MKRLKHFTISVMVFIAASYAAFVRKSFRNIHQAKSIFYTSLNFQDNRTCVVAFSSTGNFTTSKDEHFKD